MHQCFCLAQVRIWYIICHLKYLTQSWLTLFMNVHDIILTSFGQGVLVHSGKKVHLPPQYKSNFPQPFLSHSKQTSVKKKQFNTDLFCDISWRLWIFQSFTPPELTCQLGCTMPHDLKWLLNKPDIENVKWWCSSNKGFILPYSHYAKVFFPADSLQSILAMLEKEMAQCHSSFLGTSKRYWHKPNNRMKIAFESYVSQVLLQAIDKWLVDIL